jgi:transposase
MMLNIHDNKLVLVGKKGSIELNVDDEITRKLSMLIEGECEGLGPTKAAKKFGFTRQRYYQLLRQYKNKGAIALKSKKTGPQTNYKRTEELERQVIRHRCLDLDATPEVIAQKLNQCGLSISIRSVERVISQYGLQKKNCTPITPKRKI